MARLTRVGDSLRASADPSVSTRSIRASRRPGGRQSAAHGRRRPVTLDVAESRYRGLVDAATAAHRRSRRRSRHHRGPGARRRAAKRRKLRGCSIAAAGDVARRSRSFAARSDDPHSKARPIPCRRSATAVLPVRARALDCGMPRHRRSADLLIATSTHQDHQRELRQYRRRPSRIAMGAKEAITGRDVAARYADDAFASHPAEDQPAARGPHRRAASPAVLKCELVGAPPARRRG